MGMIKDLKMKWQALTPVEKVKLGVDVACGIGSAAITDRMYDRYVPHAPNKVLNTVMRFTADGAGMFVGTKASESWGEVVDAVYILNQNRKARKAAKKTGIKEVKPNA